MIAVGVWLVRVRVGLGIMSSHACSLLKSRYSIFVIHCVACLNVGQPSWHVEYTREKLGCVMRLLVDLIISLPKFLATLLQMKPFLLIF